VFIVPRLRTDMSFLDPFNDRPIGYPKLAARTEVQPEIAIYRRFGALNAQNLLYYHAELVDLEEKLMIQQVQDNNDGKGAKHKYATTWYRLKDSAADGDTKQLKLVMRMRETLKEYSKYNLCQQNVLYYTLIPSRSCSNSTIRHSQLSKTRKMGSALHPRISSVR
jgi:hypothetical protein